MAKITLPWHAGFHVKTTSTYGVGNFNISKYVPGREAAENFASKYVLAGRASDFKYNVWMRTVSKYVLRPRSGR